LLKVATEQLGYAAVDPQPGASSEGFSVIEVDDIAEAGGRACQMHAEVGSYVEVWENRRPPSEGGNQLYMLEDFCDSCQIFHSKTTWMSSSTPDWNP
jgi:hypothetical protein